MKAIFSFIYRLTWNTFFKLVVQSSIMLCKALNHILNLRLIRDQERILLDNVPALSPPISAPNRELNFSRRNVTGLHLCGVLLMKVISGMDDHISVDNGIRRGLPV